VNNSKSITPLPTPSLQSSGGGLKSNTPQMSEDNRFIDEATMAAYNKRLETERQLASAIAITTELYGAQSEKVILLQQTYDSIFDPTGIEAFSSTIDGLSTALDTLASSSDAISDNPAIRALASSLLILSSVSALLNIKSGNWIEYVVASASVAAAVIGFVTSMSGAKFATGGIVKPAPVGDQSTIRVNEGEMILNHNQQARLFNVIAKNENNNSSTGQVEFKLRGQELVGLINNYNNKYRV
jgi:hypothetical protein